MKFYFSILRLPADGTLRSAATQPRVILREGGGSSARQRFLSMIKVGDYSKAQALARHWVRRLRGNDEVVDLNGRFAEPRLSLQGTAIGEQLASRFVVDLLCNAGGEALSIFNNFCKLAD